MTDIFHNFPIKASTGKVFKAVSTPEGLDNWWTKTSAADPALGGNYSFNFGPQYHWTALVTKYIESSAIEFQMTEADADWTGTKVGFTLIPKENITEVQFYHTGWPELNAHYKISSFCWAMYLRILKRYVEMGEQVPYENRLHV